MHEKYKISIAKKKVGDEKIIVNKDLNEIYIKVLCVNRPTCIHSCFLNTYLECHSLLKCI